MSEARLRAAMAGALVIVLAAPAAWARRNPFKHQDPRWQVAATPCYALLSGYDGTKRRGGGVGASALFQLTSAFSIVIEAGWLMLPPAPRDRAATQAAIFQALVRYDIDVIDVRPYVAAGGIAAVFASGHMRDAEVGPDAPPSAVGASWGPLIEAGLDWRPLPFLVVGLALDMGWFMRFSPIEGKPWPQVRTAGAHVGIYF